MSIEVNERTTALYTVTLKDESLTVIPASDLSALTITLYDQATGTILNSRNKQSCLNANNVTVDSSGLLTWQIQPADNAIITDSNPTEVHVALFEVKWHSDEFSANHEVEITVINLAQVPDSTSTGGTESSVETDVPMPALTGSMTLDTLNALMVERLRIARSGPFVTYRLHGHEVMKNEYIRDLDERILSLRRQLAQEDAVEEIGFCF